VKYRTKDGDVLDAICWKHYGSQNGVVEAVLEANPHLSDQGAILATGVIIELPEIEIVSQSENTVRLWD